MQIKPSTGPAPSTSRVELIAVEGIPDLAPGQDVASVILAAAAESGLMFTSGDVVVVAQKIVSKSEGAYVRLDEVVPSSHALELAVATAKDPRLVEIVLGEAAEVLRARPGVLIVANRAGHVMANAGVDASNLPPSAHEHVLKLPADPDQSAQQLKMALEQATGARLGVVINDSWGRAWRNGTIGHAVGVAGLPALWDRRGEHDMYGRPLRVTEIGLADEIAAAASLVMGAAGERRPVVVVRGLALPPGDSPSTALVRDRARDLFR